MAQLKTTCMHLKLLQHLILFINSQSFWRWTCAQPSFPLSQLAIKRTRPVSVKNIKECSVTICVSSAKTFNSRTAGYTYNHLRSFIVEPDLCIDQLYSILAYQRYLRKGIYIINMRHYANMKLFVVFCLLTEYNAEKATWCNFRNGVNILWVQQSTPALTPLILSAAHVTEHISQLS